MDATNIVRILIGAILLFLGHRLFWFFVGAAGFLAGLIVAPQFFQEQPGWVLLLIALAAGLLGALLAVVLQRFAVALAGFIAGGYALSQLLAALQVELPGFDWVFFVAGGLIGAILVSVLFDWALIFLSSLIGALLIVQSLALNPTLETVLFIVLFVAGLAVQAGIYQREQVEAAAGRRVMVVEEDQEER